MENKSHALWAGFFTLAMLCATIYAAIWLSRDKTVRAEYRIVTTKPVVGLNPQANVRYKGLTVGHVDKIAFDHKVAGQIDIKISIDPDTPVTQSTFASLGYQGVTGIAFVQLDDDGTNPAKLTSNTKESPIIPLRPGLLEKLEKSSTIILANMETASQRFVQLLTPENQKTILEAFSSTSQATTRWTNVAEELSPTIKRLPALAKQADVTLLSIQSLAKSAAQLSQELSVLTNQLQDPEGPLNKTLTSYGNLGESMYTETVPKISRLADDVRNAMHMLDRTLGEFNDRPQELIFGKPPSTPGPGERGFANPEK